MALSKVSFCRELIHNLHKCLLKRVSFCDCLAMYAAKIGPHAREPNSEWAGCGFSKTTLALYPSTKKEDQHPPLVHHHSDLQDIMSRRGGAGGSAPLGNKGDLPSLLIENGLEKYVGKYRVYSIKGKVAEESGQGCVFPVKDFGLMECF